MEINVQIKNKADRILGNLVF